MPIRQWNDGQEVTFEDLNAGQKATLRDMYDKLAFEMIQRKTDGFFGDGFLVEFATSTSVTVRAGLGFQYDATQASPEPNYRPLYKAAASPISISAPDASLDRIDIVVVKSIESDEISANRKVKAAIGGAITTQNLVVQKDWDVDLQIVAGTPAASPVAPAVPAGFLQVGTVLVTTVTGIAGALAVTDDRAKLPMAGDILLNTLAKARLPAASETTLDTVLTSIDGLLANGDFNTSLFRENDQAAIDLLTTPANNLRIYNKLGVMFTKDENDLETPLGSGAGGGGGGLRWNSAAGTGPVEAEENGELVYLFEEGLANKLSVWLKVPDGYITGRQIKMRLACYTPSATDEFRMSLNNTLVRDNIDAINSITNQEAANSGDLTNTVASQYREFAVDVTDAAGLINSVGVTSKDLIKVELSRGVPAGTDDSAEIRFIPSATEVLFA